MSVSWWIRYQKRKLTRTPDPTNENTWHFDTFILFFYFICNIIYRGEVLPRLVESVLIIFRKKSVKVSSYVTARSWLVGEMYLVSKKKINQDTGSNQHALTLLQFHFGFLLRL